MSEKHTPGPWFSVKNDHYWEIKLGQSQYSEAVGDACASIHLDGGDNGEANSRLMAAAPDLLEALQECEEYFDNRADADCDQDGYVPNAELRLLGVVRDALKKAGQ